MSNIVTLNAESIHLKALLKLACIIDAFRPGLLLRKIDYIGEEKEFLTEYVWTERVGDRYVYAIDMRSNETIRDRLSIAIIRCLYEIIKRFGR